MCKLAKPAGAMSEAEVQGGVKDLAMQKLREDMEKRDVQLVWYEKVHLVIGSLMLLVLLPLTAVTVATTVLWDALDRGFMGQPQGGVVMGLARWFNRVTAPLCARFVRNANDAFAVNVVLLLGGVIPGLFFYLMYDTLTNGFNPYYCFAFHVFRLGPYFMNFAYCYTLCHKECHNVLGIFKAPYGVVLNNVFNWWIGLFFGVLPSSFAFGHAINHHRYNNGPNDIISSADKPRDSFVNFVTYVPRFALYALNVTTVIQFIRDKEYGTAIKMNVGTAVYAAWIYALYTVSPVFALWYALLPMGENILLLSAIAWCWHSFVDHKDPEDEYVNSLTLLDGPINVMGEDYHVVHHAYPGVGWWQSAEYFKRDYDAKKYHQAPATMFRGTHTMEVFFLIILREYDMLAKLMVDPRGEWTHEDKVNAIKVRLRTCWWGPRAVNVQLQGKEVRKK